MTDSTAAAAASPGLDISAMLETALSTAMTLLTTTAPFVRGTGTIGSIIDGLATVLPIVVQTAKNLAPVVKQTIAILRDNEDVTPEQLAALDAFEALIDADFDDALASARLMDAAVAAAAAARVA